MQVSEALKSRRAVNFFDPQKPVPPDLLGQLIEKAALAPSSFNLQPWSLMVLTEQVEKQKLQKLAMDQPKVSQAPVVLMVLADREAWQPGNPNYDKCLQDKIKAGMPPEKSTWFADVTRTLYGNSAEAAQALACKNAGFFGMALMLAARELGLHSHPMDGFEHNGVREAFGIPQNYWVAFLLAVGYFDESQTLAPPKWRKSYQDIVVSFD